MKKISGLLILSLYLLSFQKGLAQTDDWEPVKNLGNVEISVQKTNGETLFGRLTLVNANQIEIQIATKKDISTISTTIPKTEIKKLWRAELRFGERNTAKGALIGAGVGAAIGVGIYAGSKKSEGADGLEVLAIPIIMLPAAGVGTVVGFFSRKGHKKGKLIYKS